MLESRRCNIRFMMQNFSHGSGGFIGILFIKQFRLQSNLCNFYFCFNKKEIIKGIKKNVLLH